MKKATIICDRCKSGEREQDASDEWLYVTVIQVDEEERLLDLCPICSNAFKHWLATPPKPPLIE